jgi:hypothetical protein
VPFKCENADYLRNYITEEGFDVRRLINDDFFKAIKLLYNAKFYISAQKLLVCFIDTISFVATSGSSAASFKSWLDRYVDLKTVGITSEELWEHRNALLHLTSLDSRKIMQGKVRRCVAYVGRLPNMPAGLNGEVWYNLYDLMMAIIAGLQNFLSELRHDDVPRFIENYDNILSDTRLVVFQQSEE